MSCGWFRWLKLKYIFNAIFALGLYAIFHAHDFFLSVSQEATNDHDKSSDRNISENIYVANIGTANHSKFHSRQFPCSTPAGFAGVPYCEMNLHQNFELIKRPSVMSNQSQPILLSGMTLYGNAPEYSLVIAVYNQEGVVGRHLDLILNNTVGWWELIIVMDGCIDNSKQEVIESVQDWHYAHRQCNFDSCSPGCLVRFQIIDQQTPVDETSANNIGMRAADPRASFFVLLQPDMFIFELGWNVALSLPMKMWDDVFSVSARCAHNFNGDASVGLCGQNVDTGFKSISLSMRQTFHVRQTNNRGPLLLNATRTIRLGYLDEVSFHRGDDDHDLNSRAWFFGRWVSGFYPVLFRAPLKDGATRRPKVPDQLKFEQAFRAARKVRAESSESFLSWIRSGPSCLLSISAERTIPEQFLGQNLCSSVTEHL